MVVRVFGNTCLNPDAVGKLEMDVTFEPNVRVTKTTVFDLTGQYVLMIATTRVATDLEAKERDPIAVERDNQLHAHIRVALRDRRDAATYEEITEAIETRKRPLS